MKQPITQTNSATQSTWLTEPALWGQPKRGDGEFLAAVRQKLDQPRPTQLWLALPRLAAVSGLAVLLVVAVWLPGRSGGASIAAKTDLTEALDEFALTDISPQELADYLDYSVPAVSAEELLELDVAVVSTEDLLRLDDADFDGVLKELQETNFF